MVQPSMSMLATMPALLCRRRARKGALGALLGISLIAVLSGITGAMSPAAYGKSAKEVFAEVSSGIVVVVPMNLSGSKVALGSGVVVSKSHVATNCHVISGARQIAVRQAADAHARVTHRMMAKLTAQYPERDLCLLFVAGLSNSPALVPVPLGSARDASIGDEVYAIGAVQGLDLSLSRGIVSRLRSSDGKNTAPVIQTDAAVLSGFSGGGLFDRQGKLIGIMTFKPSSSGAGGLSRAIPVEWVNELTQTVEAPETRLAELRVLYNDSLESRTREVGALRDRSKELVAEIASAGLRIRLAQRDIDERDVRLRDLGARASMAEEVLSAEQIVSRQAREQVSLLNLQIAALRQQLARIEAALEVSEREAKEKGIQIVNLSQRLNAALASKVQELASFRSEFFGRLRKALGNRSDVRIVGDRFVFQSEVLFPSGEATLQPGGRDQVDKLAHTIKELSDKIPTDINWVLRVDGHTDRIPISTPAYPSNWELSTGRAAAVVRYLIEQGVPAGRLAATGFGEFQPIDPGNTIAAFRRNRRIEFKLTQR